MVEIVFKEKRLCIYATFKNEVIKVKLDEDIMNHNIFIKQVDLCIIEVKILIFRTTYN